VRSKFWSVAACRRFGTATDRNPGSVTEPRQAAYSKVCPPLYTNDSQIVFRKYLRQFCNSRTLPKTLDKSQKSCEARDGKEADIKTWATKTLPTLKEHQALAKQIAAKVGA